VGGEGLKTVRPENWRRDGVFRKERERGKKKVMMALQISEGGGKEVRDCGRERANGANSMKRAEVIWD